MISGAIGRERNELKVRICSNVIMKRPEQHYRLSFGVFVLNLEQNQEISLVGFFYFEH